jgi:hypothetical protein
MLQSTCETISIVAAFLAVSPLCPYKRKHIEKIFSTLSRKRKNPRILFLKQKVKWPFPFANCISTVLCKLSMVKMGF